MSLAGLLISALILTVVGLWILTPLLRAPNHTITALEEGAGVERQRERLIIFYERVLRNLHDLDEDYNTGKLDPDDYAHERELWAKRGAAALRALDELQSGLFIGTAADEAALDSEIEAAIEAAVNKQRTEPTI